MVLIYMSNFKLNNRLLNELKHEMVENKKKIPVFSS